MPAIMGKFGGTEERAAERRAKRSSRVRRRVSAFVPRTTRPARPVVER